MSFTHSWPLGSLLVNTCEGSEGAHGLARQTFRRASAFPQYWRSLSSISKRHRLRVNLNLASWSSQESSCPNVAVCFGRSMTSSHL